MKDEADVYRRLQRSLDELPVAFPATESGVELRILRRLFTPEEAEVALALSAVPQTAEKIAHRLPGRAAGELEPGLDRMVEKGAIFGGRAMERQGKKRYSRAPLVIGMYENQVDRLTKEMQQDFEQYTREGFASALLDTKTKQMRTIPVNARFVPDRLVGRYDDARKLVEEGRGPWAARNCVCRQGHDLLGEPCKQTASRRVCPMIGPAAKASTSSGEGHALSREETIAAMHRPRRARVPSPPPVRLRRPPLPRRDGSAVSNPQCPPGRDRLRPRGDGEASAPEHRVPAARGPAAAPLLPMSGRVSSMNRGPFARPAGSSHERQRASTSRATSRRRQAVSRSPGADGDRPTPRTAAAPGR